MQGLFKRVRMSHSPRINPPQRLSSPGVAYFAQHKYPRRGCSSACEGNEQNTHKKIQTEAWIFLPYTGAQAEARAVRN